MEASYWFPKILEQDHNREVGNFFQVWGGKEKEKRRRKRRKRKGKEEGREKRREEERRKEEHLEFSFTQIGCESSMY